MPNTDYDYGDRYCNITVLLLKFERRDSYSCPAIITIHTNSS